MPRGEHWHLNLQRPCPHGCGFTSRAGTVTRHSRTCFTPRTFERLCEIGSIDTSNPDACWEFHPPYAKAQVVHGRLNGEWTHRISFELHYGPVPVGLFVLHHCDNPPCVNPRHIYAGTQGNNIQDQYDHGGRDHERQREIMRNANAIRWARGERSTAER